jgi:hypothetical protein
MKSIRIGTGSACAVQGCILETGAAKSGPNAQNAASGAMKCVQVQKTGKMFIFFFCHTE